MKFHIQILTSSTLLLILPILAQDDFIDRSGEYLISGQYFVRERYVQDESIKLSEEYAIPRLSKESVSFDIEEYIDFLERKSTISGEAHLRQQLSENYETFDISNGKEYIAPRDIVTISLEEINSMEIGNRQAYQCAFQHWNAMKNEETEQYSYSFWRGVYDDDLVYISSFREKNSIFTTEFVFYGNGSIKKKRVTAEFGVNVKMEYHYDLSGKLVREIDHERGWNFTSEDVMLFCQQNKIPVNAEDRGAFLRLRKLSNAGKKYWEISSPRMKSGEMYNYFYRIDGETGEQIGNTEEVHVEQICGQQVAQEMHVQEEYAIPPLSKESESIDVEGYIEFLGSARFNVVEGEKEYITPRDVFDMTPKESELMNEVEREAFEHARIDFNSRLYENDDQKIVSFDRNEDLSYSLEYKKQKSLFTTFKDFHANGKIKNKYVVMRDLWVEVGMEYYYDLQGELIQTVDHEEGWGFTTADVMTFCYKNKIPVNAEVSNITLEIERWRELDNKKYWRITSYEKKTKGIDRYTYLLDGDTGRQIGDREKVSLDKVSDEYTIPLLDRGSESVDLEEYINFLEEKSTPSGEQELREELNNIYEKYEVVGGKEYISPRDIVNVTLEELQAMGKGEREGYNEAFSHWGAMKNEETELYDYKFDRYWFRGEGEDQGLYYVSFKQQKNSLFSTYKYFHPNGNIKSKTVRTNDGLWSIVGTEYHYDEEGKLIKEINHEEGWNFTSTDVMAFCQENEIPVNAELDSLNLEIRRCVSDGEKYWRISSFQKKLEKLYNVVYKIDGTTGKQIGETEEVHMLGF